LEVTDNKGIAPGPARNIPEALDVAAAFLKRIDFVK